MTKIIKKRIGINQLKIGMVLGDDVLNSNGLILIPKNTIINEKHIFRLKLYHILSVIIKVKADEENINDSNQVSVIKDESKEFNSFVKSYRKHEDMVRKQLKFISNGENIDSSKLLSISSSLLYSLKTKSNLFNYLHRLKITNDHTYSHSLNVSLLCNIFGNWLNMPKSQIDNLTIAGLLHDIGKIQIDLNILNKPGKLTSNEFEEVKKHTIYGYNMLKKFNLPEEILLGVLMHHEKIDGSGYPNGLTNSEINDFAKIISIVDIYDAMTSYRSYHDKFSPFKVIQIFEQESYGILDTKYLFVFLQNIAHNYLGEVVKLSTGDEAKIIFIHNQTPSRPLVQVGKDMIDLMFEPSITIEEIIS